VARFRPGLGPVEPPVKIEGKVVIRKAASSVVSKTARSKIDIIAMF